MKNFLTGLVLGVVLTAGTVAIYLVNSGQCLRVFSGQHQQKSGLALGKCPVGDDDKH